MKDSCASSQQCERERGENRGADHRDAWPIIHQEP